MADPLIAKLGTLIGRVAALEADGARDAALNLSIRTAEELGTLSDADVRVVFAGFLGWFAASVRVGGATCARPYLDTLNEAARDGRPDALRACVSAILSMLKADA